MTETRKLITVKAMGDGNCAYNAFILGFCTPDVLASIDAGAVVEFTILAAPALGLKEEAKWDAVKAEILRLARVDATTLQKKLAMAMRQLSIDLINADENYYTRSREHIMSAMINGDDVYSRHAFIKKKYNELKDEVAFLAWWEQSGYQLFLTAMRNDGQWAGGQELSALANYFDVNFDVCRKDIKVSMNDPRPKRPTVILRNDHATHWDAVREAAPVFSIEKAITVIEKRLADWNNSAENKKSAALWQEVKSGKKVVSAADQEKLDEAYAIELQEEELKQYRSRAGR